MYWYINITKNIQLYNKILKNRHLEFDLKLPGLRYIGVETLVGFFTIQYIKDYIIKNQFRFKKTRYNLGVALQQQPLNYIPRNVGLLGCNSRQIVIDLRIKGIERYFKPLYIVPKRAKWLTIPVKKESWNKSAREFTDLFKPKGKNVLARKKGKSLEILYALTKHVVQAQDTRMLPNEMQILNYLDMKLRKIIRKK